MGLFSCFSSQRAKKEQKTSVKPVDSEDKVKTLHVKLEKIPKSSENTEFKSTSFTVPVPFHISGGSSCNIKVMSNDSPVATDSADVDYEGGDEQDDCLSIKRDNSDFDLQARAENSNVDDYQTVERLDATSSPDVVNDFEFVTSGHASDPGKGKVEIWASPQLKRSCSSLEMRNMRQELLLPSKSKSYEDIQKLAMMHANDVLVRDSMSPVSVMSHRSADKVMLKKTSSSQILPSRSRRLWWKLFLWSHRNLHRPETTVRPAIVSKLSILSRQGGYSSDTLEPMRSVHPDKFKSPALLNSKSMDKGKSKLDDQKWDGFYGDSGMWPQHQWVAFPTESSPLARIDEWVKEVSSQPPCEVEDHGVDDDIIFPSSPENDAERGSVHLGRHLPPNVPEDILHANSVVQSLNASSSVAHITGLGLKVVPSLSHFPNLRSINLSGNCIVHITPGSLPKGLHVLDLSRNRISTIEGLKELTHLRVLDLSYNRITRIGQGLSNCTMIKELYLAGNKISDVEGLHRLLKLIILDLSFNKISTAKALGQLVANYNSLIALNLLGNPIQNNINDDQLRKTVCSLLPKLAYLNKQPINPQKAREVQASAIAKAALGSNARNSRRKTVKRVTHGSSSSRRSIAGGTTEKSRPRSRSHSRHHVASKDRTH